MGQNLRKTAAIIGIGETEVGVVPNKSSMQFHVEAAKLAIEDCGIEKSEIDGVLTCGSMVEDHPHHSVLVSEYMGILPKFTNTERFGGASKCAMVFHAAMAVSLGICQNVLVVTGDNLLSGKSREGAVKGFAENRHPEFEIPYGATIITCYALAAQRHMFEFGTKPEQLASVSVAMRKHASLNPKAQKRELIKIEDVISSKMVSSPLHLLDCSLISDGGGAVIVTSAERAKNCKKSPVYILGGGEGFTHEHISQAPTLTSFGAVQSGRSAFGMAGVRPEDIDVAGLYDAFTICPIIALEDLGFCKKGEGGPFVEGGRIELGGKLPVNPHGGLLSHAHPGVPGGIFHVLEMVRQLRGEAGDRQVKDAKLSLVHGSGGPFASHCTLILGR
jgi:acetyl-CoA acetyltransferase